MWRTVGVMHQLVKQFRKYLTQGSTVQFKLLKAGKIVKLFIILILMLLGKAYYDIQS